MLTSCCTVQVPYSTFIHGLKAQNIHLNRKTLAELAVNEPYSFQALVNQVKEMRAGLGTEAASKLPQSPQ